MGTTEGNGEMTGSTFGQQDRGSAWNVVHLKNLEARTFELHGPYHQISDAEADTICDVYATAEAAHSELPHIPIELLRRAFSDYGDRHPEE